MHTHAHTHTHTHTHARTLTLTHTHTVMLANNPHMTIIIIMSIPIIRNNKGNHTMHVFMVTTVLSVH